MANFHIAVKVEGGTTVAYLEQGQALTLLAFENSTTPAARIFVLQRAASLMERMAKEARALLKDDP